MILLLPGNCFWVGMLLTIVLLGFAYIILAHSIKLSGALKSIGTALVVIILGAAVFAFGYGAIYNGCMMKHWTAKYDKYYLDKGTEVKINIEAMRDEEIYNMIKESMKRPAMRKLMIDLMENNGHAK